LTIGIGASGRRRATKPTAQRPQRKTKVFLNYFVNPVKHKKTTLFYGVVFFFRKQKLWLVFA